MSGLLDGKTESVGRMRCPKCGADNPESADFCSLCADRLHGGAAPSATYPTYGTSGQYVAPSEWRGDAEAMRPALSAVVEKKVRRFRWRMLTLGLIMAAAVAWLALSLTVWTNPSPGEVCDRLLEAVNRRDEASFTELFSPQDRAVARDMYQNLSLYLGSSGRYSSVSVHSEKLDAYSARCHLKGGSIVTGSGYSMEINPGNNLFVAMENRDGRWYVTAMGTDIMP